MRRPAVNIAGSERVCRIVLGGAAAIAGAVLLASACTLMMAMMMGMMGDGKQK